MSITQKMLELDPSLHLSNEGHWDKALDLDKPGFTSFNDAGLEVETGELLHAFIRALKPANVLETGTHVGVGASYLGFALERNKAGHLDTVEFLPELHVQAAQRVARMGLNEFVTCHFGDVADFSPESAGVEKYQFILLDTEPQTRFAEFQKFWPYLDEGGYLFIHDLHRHMHQIPNEEHGFAWPFGELPEFMLEAVKSGAARPIHFPTPRGLTGFYKVSQSDFVWQK